MDRNIFFNIKNKSVKNSKSSSSLPSPFSNTIPPQECNEEGFPISKYAGYGVPTWEVLYSSWVSYQSTLGAQFTANQALNFEPTSSATTGPKNIYLMRHGETSSSYNLNNNGIYRACQLITYINQLAAEGNPISYIIASNSCPYNSADSSMCPLQSASLASFMLNIPIFVFGGEQDFTSIIQAIFNINPTDTTLLQNEVGPFDNQNIMIIWEHSASQQLTLNLLDQAAALPTSTSTAGTVSRLPIGIPNGNEFFKNIIVNPNTDGQYRSPEIYPPGSSTVSPYFPPPPGTIPGVGDGTYSYPYWNTKNYDHIYLFKSSPATNYIFEFEIINQPCLTCYANCDLKIGLYQPLKPPCNSSYHYYTNHGTTPDTEPIEVSCQLPLNWAYHP